MNKLYLIIICILLSGCARGIVPIPETLMPERFTGNVAKSEYGTYPNNYQKILKDYLKKNLLNQSDAKIEFVNQPAPLSVQQMGSIYHGYRICLSINSRNNKNIYTGFKTHLFIIKDENVDLHLFDSGLLKIPFELCVDIDESRAFYLDDIPDSRDEITIDEMDQIKIESDKYPKSLNENTYILCKLRDVSRTFVFNENDNSLTESIGIDEIIYNNVEYSKTHILGLYMNEEILINRVSGEISSSYDNGKPILGACELLDRRKF